MATQQEQSVIRLREMILNGGLPAGCRVTETAVADQLQLSRTPVRYALTVLEQEGLLTRLDNKRGYVVSRFSADDVRGAIEVRGVLEGLAARMLAEQGAGDALRQDLRSCLEEGDAIFAKGWLEEGDLERYAAMNAGFHRLIVEASRNHPLGHILAINGSIPFAHAGSFAFRRADLGHQYRILNYAHMQHHAIVGAILDGEAGRAEALMREHANVSRDSLELSGADALQPEGSP
ncbi:transcriptional regulator, GntR family [Noviherbaspirillum humi]|uniref:Transcriptional regulator, GntR family n=1 Tax=Noviherbaspirillum humi TaxID=1688639 RepID=A0A239LBL0_9BURK|nr:GntR family transcriptional regulator [Noviherbaspirillum humi]SNT27680.1 transcriptional regulator, GntR family [Noviherbaspirillum humi]